MTYFVVMAHTGAKQREKEKHCPQKMPKGTVKHGQKHESTLVSHSTDGENCVI